MIIRKKEFAYSKKTRGQWPFTVPEVAVISVRLTDTKPEQYAFAVVNNWSAWALSGILVGHGFAGLEHSGIWADNPYIKGTKKPLDPFFRYIQKRLNAGKQ